MVPQKHLQTLLFFNILVYCCSINKCSSTLPVTYIRAIIFGMAQESFNKRNTNVSAQQKSYAPLIIGDTNVEIRLPALIAK